jgi:hypothetical protein
MLLDGILSPCDLRPRKPGPRGAGIVDRCHQTDAFFHGLKVKAFSQSIGRLYSQDHLPEKMVTKVENPLDSIPDHSGKGRFNITSRICAWSP